MPRQASHRRPHKTLKTPTRKLDELARDLESARRRLVQPQLDRYRAHEKMAAKVQEQINSVKDGGQQAQAKRSSLRTGPQP